jgi:hypothetical protein
LAFLLCLDLERWEASAKPPNSRPIGKVYAGLDATLHATEHGFFGEKDGLVLWEQSLGSSLASHGSGSSPADLADQLFAWLDGCACQPTSSWADPAGGAEDATRKRQRSGHGAGCLERALSDRFLGSADRLLGNFFGGLERLLFLTTSNLAKPCTGELSGAG